MKKSSGLSPFEELPELKGVFVARNANLRCTALSLKDGGVCLFNPVLDLGDAAIQSLIPIGSVTYLLAPNHYHNKGLREYRDAFQGAQLCASQTAEPRLVQQTNLVFERLDDLAERLPGGIDILQPKGLKTGEVWLRAKQRGECVWFVVDAFAGTKMAGVTAKRGAASFLKTFPSYGVGHANDYNAWLSKQLQKDKPTLVVPCHGAIFGGSDLSLQLESLVDEYL